MIRLLLAFCLAALALVGTRSAQAAEALKPVAGTFAEFIFALGIIGTGLLAVPVLAGSTAYAIGEGRRWPVGLSRKPKEAVAFYSVLALSVALGVIINFTGIDPIKALYWSAVINGVLAAPVMAIMMLLVRRRPVMGDLIVKGPVYWLGWIATAAHVPNWWADRWARSCPTYGNT